MPRTESPHSVVAEKEAALRPARIKRWAPGEDAVLQRAVTLVPRDTLRRWTRIAERVPDRTAKQCRARWTEYLDPVRESRAWTEEDSDLLHFLVRTVGKAWSRLAPRFLGRTPNDLKNRFARIARPGRRTLDSAEAAGGADALSAIAELLTDDVTLSSSLCLPPSEASPPPPRPPPTDNVWKVFSFAAPPYSRISLPEDTWVTEKGWERATTEGERRSENRRRGGSA
jgi:pre-mRNA-splicing factor CDC5/CEF1